MTITTIDPKSALIVIDLQKGLSLMPLAHPFKNIVANANALSAEFRRHNLPVVLVNVDGTPSGRTDRGPFKTDGFPPDWMELATELTHESSDHLVTKQTAGAFTNTGLNEYLKGEGVTQVVVIGISTSSGVESTARQAYENGYNVTLAIDAMTDRTIEDHEFVCSHMLSKMGETGTTKEILTVLENSHG